MRTPASAASRSSSACVRVVILRWHRVDGDTGGDNAALLRELLFSVLELPDEHLDGVDAAFLLQAVLGRRVDVNGAGVECEGALRDRQRRESGGAAKKQCSQDALHVWY